jgi:hypothetical protein
MCKELKCHEGYGGQRDRCMKGGVRARIRRMVMKSFDERKVKMCIDQDGTKNSIRAEFYLQGFHYSSTWK